MKEPIGLVGFGIMGAAITPRLIEHGYHVIVFDTSAAAMSRARDGGCATAMSPSDMARQTRTMLISLPKPEHVRQVVSSGDDCLLAGAQEGSVIVDTSTVDPATSQSNARAALELGVGYLDCPILGRPSGAGHWTLPTGGEPQHIAAAEPVLRTFAARIIHVGPSGHGNMVKLLNNLMFGAINAVTCEVFALAKCLGMEPGQLFDTIADSGAATVSNLFMELGPKIVARDFAPDFTVDNLGKDIGLGLAMAQECGITLEVSEIAQGLTRLAQDSGLGQEDTSAVVKVLEQAPASRVP